MTVQDLLLSLLPRLDGSTGVNIIQAANAAVRSIGKELAYRRSDLIRQTVSFNFPAGKRIGLPVEFLGFSEDPYLLSGNTKIELTPLLPGERADKDKIGTPQKYELVGAQLYLFPYPDATVTVKGIGFWLPESLYSLTDELPWENMMDELLTEAVFRISSEGLNHAVDPVFRAFIKQELEQMLSVRTGARPRRASGFHY